MSNKIQSYHIEKLLKERSGNGKNKNIQKSERESLNIKDRLFETLKASIREKRKGLSLLNLTVTFQVWENILGISLKKINSG